MWSGLTFPSDCMNLAGLKVSGSDQSAGSLLTAHCSGMTRVPWGSNHSPAHTGEITPWGTP